METGLADNAVAASRYHPLCLLIADHAGVLLYRFLELFLGVGPGCRWLLPWVGISYGLGPILHLSLRALPWVAPSLPPWEGSAHLCVHVVR